METIIILVLIIAFVIYLLAQDSKADTKKEKYGDAIGQLAKGTADTIAGFAHSIVEPADKKAIRLAKEHLAYKNGILYRARSFDYSEGCLNRMLEIDNNFKKDLELLGLSETRWKKIGKEIFYIGVLIRNSLDNFHSERKSEMHSREHILYEMVNDSFLSHIPKYIAEALDYFGIQEIEWIEFGYSVVDMYNLWENKDLEEFGTVSLIINPHNTKFNL